VTPRTGTRCATVCQNPIPYLYPHYPFWKHLGFTRTRTHPYAPIDKPAHVYETFRAPGDYSVFEAEVLRPIIHGTHQQSYIYPSKLPELPLPISHALPHCSIESIHCLILEMDYNHPSQDITFPHYIAPSPNQSAHVPITCCILVSGQFSLKYPDYFMV
jgi:hypothetical protein